MKTPAETLATAQKHYCCRKYRFQCQTYPTRYCLVQSLAMARTNRRADLVNDQKQAEACDLLGKSMMKLGPCTVPMTADMVRDQQLLENWVLEPASVARSTWGALVVLLAVASVGTVQGACLRAEPASAVPDQARVGATGIPALLP